MRTYYAAVLPLVLFLVGVVALFPGYGRADRDEVSPLLLRLRTADPAGMLKLMTELKEKPDLRTVQPLCRLLIYPEAPVREAAAETLTALREWGTVPALLTMLGADDAHSVTAAAKLLGKLEDFRAVNPLVQVYLRDKRPPVRKAALYALAQLNRHKAVPYLETLLPELKNLKTAGIHRNLPGLSHTLPPRFMVLHPGGIAEFYFTRKGNTYVAGKSFSYKGLRHIAAGAGGVYTATKKEILRLDNELKLLNKKRIDAGEVASIAFGKGHVLASVDGYFTLFDSQLRRVARVPLVFMEDGKKYKDAHHMVVYRDAAYLLDNVVSPVYVLKMGLRDIRRPRVRESIKVYPVGPNSIPHLTGQWLEPEQDRWVLISESVHILADNSGRPSQHLAYLPLLNPVELEEGESTLDGDLDNTSDLCHSASRFRQFSQNPPVKGFRILANLSLAPVWVVAEEGGQYFLGRVRIARNPDVLKQDSQQDYLHQGILSRCYYLGDRIELPEKRHFSILRYDRFLLVCDGFRLKVFDAAENLVRLITVKFPFKQAALDIIIP